MNAEMDISKNQWRSTGGKIPSNSHTDRDLVCSCRGVSGGWVLTGGPGGQLPIQFLAE